MFFSKITERQETFLLIPINFDNFKSAWIFV